MPEKYHPCPHCGAAPPAITEFVALDSYFCESCGLRLYRDGAPATINEDMKRAAFELRADAYRASETRRERKPYKRFGKSGSGR